MTEQVIAKDGEAYISISAMQEVLEVMLAVRDQFIERDERLSVLVPGTDHAVSFLNQILENTRFKFFDQQNLEGETEELLNGLKNLLDEA